VARLAAEKGLEVEEKGGDTSLVISTTSPEEALAQLRLLGGILSPRT
jgi:hypothetical protein